jgi:hypothetical protein
MVEQADCRTAGNLLLTSASMIKWALLFKDSKRGRFTQPMLLLSRRRFPFLTGLTNRPD